MAAPPQDKQRSLRLRLWELQNEFARVQADLLALGPGSRLPGLYAVLQVGPYQALLPTARVKEIVRLVAFTAVPNPPRHVAGTFVCRGQPVIAVDLASWLGLDREPPLDGHIVVVGGARLFGLVVDRVRSVVDGPVLIQGELEDGTEVWRGSGLAVGLCRCDDQVLPLLSLAQLDSIIGEAPR